MSAKLLIGVSLAALCAYGPAFGQGANTPLQDVIVVTGERQVAQTQSEIVPENGPMLGVDLAGLAQLSPGGGLIGNGPVSGQMAYRGLFGERLNLRLDGQSFASGGPNLMDPTFHYAPAPLVAALVIDRGVSPVSAGPGLAGGADAIFKKVDFSDQASPRLAYDLSIGGRQANESVSTGGIVGASTARWRGHLLGAYELGEDTEFPRGEIGGTAFKRSVYGASAGLRLGEQDLSIDLRRQNTGDSGNPPFPMDIRYVDTDFARLGFDGSIGSLAISASVEYTDVIHWMDNFNLRPAPMAMQTRANFATAETYSGNLTGTYDWSGQSVSFGIDGAQNLHNGHISNPLNSAFLCHPSQT